MEGASIASAAPYRAGAASALPLSATSGAAAAVPLGSGDAAGLSARNVSITRKVNKLLDVDSNEQFRQVLAHVEASCPALLTPEGQAGLRTGARLQAAVAQPLHQRVLDLHDELLAQLGEMRDVYRLVASDVKELEAVANEMHAAMADAAARAEPLVTAVAVYREEAREIKAREAQVAALMGRYKLSSEEAATLEAGPIDEDFLRCLLRVRSIHSSCRELLLAEHQQAVIEIIEHMYMLQVRATERLAAWLCTRCGEVLTADAPVLSDFFIKCVGVTYDRPAQFMRVINEAGRARKATTIRRFYDLLSRGGNGHQPLDALAGDPVRYIGALLSWIHQSIAEEEDLLRCFFPRGANTAASTATAVTTSNADDAAADATGDGGVSGGGGDGLPAVGIKDVMDQIFEPLSPHFRTRFDQVTDRCVRSAGGAAITTAMGGDAGGPSSMHSMGATAGSAASSSGAASGASSIASGSTGSVMLVFFQLEGILGFYGETISHLLGPSASLSCAVGSAKLDAMRVFYNFLQLGTSQMLSSVGGSGGGGGGGAPAFLPRDLATTREADAMLHLLKCMLDSMSEGLVPHNRREAEMGPILGAVVDPLVNIATAGGGSGGGSSDASDGAIARLVFSVNIVSRLHQLLSQYPFTLGRAEQLSAVLAAESSRLTEGCVARAMAQTGDLAGRAALLAARLDPNGPLFRAPLAPEEAASVEAAARQLYHFVYSVGALPTASVDRIANFRQRTEVLSAVTSAVCGAYERLYALVHRGGGGGAEEGGGAAAAADAFPLTTGGFCDAALRAAFVHSPRHMSVLLDVDAVAAAGGSSTAPL